MKIDILVKSVSKSFPIHQFLGRMKKSIKWLPEEVLIKVCESYLKNSHKVVKPWPWFVRATNECWRAYNAEQSIAEGQRLKTAPVPKELQNLVNEVLKRR